MILNTLGAQLACAYGSGSENFVLEVRVCKPTHAQGGDNHPFIHTCCDPQCKMHTGPEVPLLPTKERNKEKKQREEGKLTQTLTSPSAPPVMQ
jgi:hypothetical protein